MRINVDDTDLDDALCYIYNGDLFTAELVETNPAGAVVALTMMRNGRPHGLVRTWYPNGILESEAMTVDGNAVGVSRAWHRNGQLAEERDFTDHGRLHTVRRWAEDGTPMLPDPPRT